VSQPSPPWGRELRSWVVRFEHVQTPVHGFHPWLMTFGPFGAATTARKISSSACEMITAQDQRCGGAAGNFRSPAFVERAGVCGTTPINKRVGCAALECGSSLPLLLQPACWLQDRTAMEVPASKLAGGGKRQRAAALQSCALTPGGNYLTFRLPWHCHPASDGATVVWER
jgi:hypothetical protein